MSRPDSANTMAVRSSRPPCSSSFSGFRRLAARMLECTKGGGYRRPPERTRHDAGPGAAQTPGPAWFPPAVVGQTLVVAAWDTGAVPAARPGAFRLENAIAPISTTRETPAMVKRAASLSCRLMMAGSVRSDDQVHHLDQRVQGRSGGVLERVADGVADDGRLVGLGALAAVVAVLDVLLGVVPRPTGVGQVVGHQLAGQDDRGQEAAEGGVADAEADDDGRQDGEERRRGQLPQGRRRADVDDGPVVRGLLTRHDLPVGELRADLLHDDTRGAAHGADGEGGEQEGDQATDEEADERLGVWPR